MRLTNYEVSHYGVFFRLVLLFCSQKANCSPHHSVLEHLQTAFVPCICVRPSITHVQENKKNSIIVYKLIFTLSDINPLTPNDPYSGRTAPLTSKRCILYIYLTNTGNEYFKHGIYSPFFLFKMQFVS